MKKSTILIIEDNRMILENTTELLGFYDYKVITASDGAKGIQIATQKNPDLILCDIVMGNADGFEVIKTLKNNPLTATIPFIFLSAQSEKSIVDKALSLGANAFMVKPYSVEELMIAISKHIKPAAIKSELNKKLNP